MYVIHNEITAHITVITYKMSLSCKRIEYLVFFVVYVLERIHYFLLVLVDDLQMAILQFLYWNVVVFIPVVAIIAMQGIAYLLNLM